MTKSRFFREIEILPIGLPGRPAPKPSRGWFSLSTDTPPFRNWSYDVAIQTDDPFIVKGNLANGSIEGRLHLGGTGLAPTLEGTAHIENFVASLPFSQLTVDHGSLYFSGNAPLNPQLDVHGSSRIRDYNVNVYLYGTASEPQTLFTSEPSLPQEEVIALLATRAAPPCSCSRIFRARFFRSARRLPIAPTRWTASRWMSAGSTRARAGRS